MKWRRAGDENTTTTHATELGNGCRCSPNGTRCVNQLASVNQRVREFETVAVAHQRQPVPPSVAAQEGESAAAEAGSETRAVDIGRNAKTPLALANGVLR